MPVKYEHVVFCALSPFQVALYERLVKSPEVRATISASSANPLVVIGMFQKLVNHLDLLDVSGMPGIEDVMPDGYHPGDKRRDLSLAFSGKMLVLER